MNAQPPANNAETILFAALDHAPEDREAFLKTACKDNAALLAEVRGLLAAHEAMPSGFLDVPAVNDLDVTIKAAPGTMPSQRTLPPSEKSGDRIGPYKLLQEIGEGGFGTVWMADQEQPVRRRVALKIIKLGMDTKEVVARFEQERQALAMMDHPNIARVFDAGATEQGRPFFVMELVRGMKITDYCDEKGLSTAERVELFILVCQAVQHAHQKGIIHRDLKPSNILVTVNDGKAVPKVIDFGVAKATQGKLADGTLFTQFEQMIGTPLYMSPEQAEMTSLDVDTRSDIYALGVLLYELLTGRTPIDTATMAKAGMGEIRRLIREVDPPRPSMRLKTLDGNELTSMAKRRHTEPTKLPGALRGDIDWIVMKCLEKDRGRRYDTANGLALDLQRHLSNEVVIARPPTTAYLLSKLIRRNKVAFAAGTAIAASLVIGITVSVWQAVLATRAKKEAVTAFDELRATAPAFAEQARGLAAKEQYADAITKLDYAIKLRPDAAEFLMAKADLLQCQLKLAEAAAIYREALRVQPGLARAEASAKLCDELLAAPPGNDGKLSLESLGKLHLAMQKQQRPAAELLPVARLLGTEKSHLIAYWLDRLKDLPISAEKPLKDRLTVRDDGLLALDLASTQIADLTPLAGMPLGKLVLMRCGQLSDFTPLREFRSLTALDLAFTAITDLAPLRGLPLTELLLEETAVSDLSPLRGMKLKTIDLWFAKVSDLTPLAGMPITEFYASRLPTTDFSVLKGAPLESFALGDSQVRNLSFLEGSGVKTVFLSDCDTLRELSILPRLRALERLILPRHYRRLPDVELTAIAALREHPTLKWIQVDPGEGGGRGWWMMYLATQPKETFWRDWDREQAFLPAIRRTGFDFWLAKLPDDTYRLSIQKQPLSDLSFLKNAPISELILTDCKVTDLTPIRDLPLRILQLSGNPVTDLEPLRDMPLEILRLVRAPVSDLTPLGRLPLKELYLVGCANVTDVAVIAGITTLEKLTVPPHARSIESLREHTGLRMLAFGVTGDSQWLPNSTAKAFWEMWPKLGWLRALIETGLAPALRPLADGTWEVDLQDKAISDLSILSGAPISILKIGSTPVSDLIPLRGMPLKQLYLYQTKVTDLRPLEGMALENLKISATEVSDLSVLRGMPLKSLRLHNCTKLTDLSPLAEAKTLTNLTLPPNATDIEFLRALPMLTHISFNEDPQEKRQPDKTLDEFWKEYDSQGWLWKLRASGVAIKSAKRLADGTWDLDLTGAAISDLTPLRSTPVSILNLSKTAVTNLEPLRGMALKELNISDTQVADLTPLRGMALKKLFVGKTKVADLSPLKGMPLEVLLAADTQVTDLSPLRGMPLTRMTFFKCAGLSDLSPLADSKTLTDLTLPPNAKDIEFLRAHPKLEHLGFGFDPKTFLPDQTATEFWKEYDSQGWLKALRASGVAIKSMKRLEDGTWDLDLAGAAISDLKLLSGAPIRILNLGNTAITDLAPLRGMALKQLQLYNTKVADLGPLKGMPLEHLHVSGTPVTDLTPLRGMGLLTLRLHNCTQLTDLTPLAEAKTLTSLTLPPNAKDIEFLRAFPKLERLGTNDAKAGGGLPGQPVAEFWKEWDARK